jgi:hypothetical protein
MKEVSKKKRNKQFIQEKLLNKLKRKDEEINNDIRNQGWVELEKPIHHGFYIEYILRDDILRRDDAAAYQEALNVCMEKSWCKDDKFKHKDYKTKKWYDILPKLHNISKEKYEQLSPSAKKFFVEDTNKERKYWRYGFSNKWYVCTLSYELVKFISKAYITHRREHDSVLYQMEAENEKLMYQVAGNDNPWGSNRGYGKWWRKHENKKEKLSSERELVEVKKSYQGIKSKKDLLDL